MTGGACQPEALPVIHELETILEPLDFKRLFGNDRPVHLELGSGDGSFLVQYAHAHPEVNFVGVERLLGRLRKIERKARRMSLKNVRGIRIEASYLIKYLMPPGSLEAIHIYFPDPWPKRRHLHNRIVNEQFPVVAERALRPGGAVFLRTDDADYFGQMRRVFAGFAGFKEIPTPGELASVVTDFEIDFNAKGIATLRAAYLKQSG